MVSVRLIIRKTELSMDIMSRTMKWLFKCASQYALKKGLDIQASSGAMNVFVAMRTPNIFNGPGRTFVITNALVTQHRFVVDPMH